MFGEVKSGKSVVRKIENMKTQEDKPGKDVVIADCGELSGPIGGTGEAKTADAYGDEYEDFPEDDTTEQPITAARVLKVAGDCKDFGNKAFKAGDVLGGLEKYQKGLRYLNEEPDFTDDGEEAEIRPKLDALRFTLNCNSALLNLKIESWEEAERSAAAALAVGGSLSDAEKAKALYRRGVALVKLRDEDAAIAALEEAKKLVPGDAAITKELDAVKKQASARLAKEKAAYKKFFA